MYYITVNSMQGMIYMYVHQEAGMQPNKEEVLGHNFYECIIIITVNRHTRASRRARNETQYRGGLGPINKLSYECH